jgi:hypothetical protein
MLSFKDACDYVTHSSPIKDKYMKTKHIYLKNSNDLFSFFFCTGVTVFMSSKLKIVIRVGKLCGNLSGRDHEEWHREGKTAQCTDLLTTLSKWVSIQTEDP